MAQLPLLTNVQAAELVHLRAPQPIHFPEEAEGPESKRHLLLRTFLFRLLRFALGSEHSVGSDQFVYWNARDPRRCLAPDVFLKRGVPDSWTGSWKTWQQGGVPELAVEIVGPNEGDGVDWDEKLARYHELGVHELVRFDPEEPEGQRVRVWDRLQEGDFVERRVEDDKTPCIVLGLHWTICPVEGQPAGLRLIDHEGHMLQTPEEAADARTAAAEARVRELEAELARRSR